MVAIVFVAGLLVLLSRVDPDFAVEVFLLIVDAAGEVVLAVFPPIAGVTVYPLVPAVFLPYA